MPHRLLVAFTIAVIVCLSGGATRVAAQATPQATQNAPVILQLSRITGLLLARGAINGKDAGWFVVDTGASTVLLDADLAKKLNLPAIGRARMNAVGGIVDSEVVLCDRFELGGAHLGDPSIVTASMRPMSSLLGVEISGLVGGEALAGNVFTIDFRDETLTLHDPGSFRAPATTQPHAIRMIRQTPTVPVSIEGRIGWFEIDTGAMASLYVSGVFLSFARDLLENKRVRSSLSFGAGGKQEEFNLTFASVQALGRTFEDCPASYALVSEDVNAYDIQRAGRIGVRLLRDARVTFDYADNKVWVEWREPEATDALVARLKASAARSLTKETPLMLAASRGREDAVRALLDQTPDAASVNAGDATGFTALIDAASSSDPGAEACAAMLIERGANVDAQAVVMGLSAMHYAVSEGKLATVKRLLAARADANVRTTLNHTPISRAAEGRWIEIARILLDAGADPKIARKTGETPLMLAAANGDVEMIALLLDRGADVNQTTGGNGTALISAVGERKPAAVKLLLERGAAVSMRYTPSTALHLAAQSGDLESARLLLAAGADLTRKDREGKTPLDRAAASGRMSVLRLLLEAEKTAATTTRPGP